MKYRGKQYSVVLSIGGKWNWSVEIDGHTKSGSAASCQHWSNKRAGALRRARGLPVGADRNDLRQLATGLLWLHRNGMDALTRLRLEDHFDGGSIDPSREDETVANLSG